jgi:membrane-associated protease RseP (regulator of RpoE activity)
MKIRNLLLLFAIVLLATAAALAQRTPPSPSTPPPVVTAPVPPDEAMSFSFSFDGGGYLGITTENISTENLSEYGLSAPRGVGISSVSQGSPAERAGLKKGDVILQFDGEAVTSTRKLLRLVGEAVSGQTVRLTISRKGSEQQVTVTLGKREEPLNGYHLAIPAEPRNFPRTPRPQGTWNYGPELFSLGVGNNRRVGVTTTALTTQLADFFGVSAGHGLLISSVTENSPASKAGVKAGDVVTEVNGEKIEDSDDFVRAINSREEGDVTLTIIRDKSQRTIKVTPERRPAPTFNLSDFPSKPMAKVLISPGNLINMPDVRVLHSMPRIESFTMPRLDGLVFPRVMSLPRVLSVPKVMSLPGIGSLLNAPCPTF